MALWAKIKTFVGGGSGTVAQAGTATLVTGTVTVSNISVTASSIIIVSRKVAGGSIGDITWTLIPGVSFTLTSDHPLDTSTMSFLLV